MLPCGASTVGGLPYCAELPARRSNRIWLGLRTHLLEISKVVWLASSWPSGSPHRPMKRVLMSFGALSLCVFLRLQRRCHGSLRLDRDLAQAGVNLRRQRRVAAEVRGESSQGIVPVFVAAVLALPSVCVYRIS